MLNRNKNKWTLGICIYIDNIHEYTMIGSARKLQKNTYIITFHKISKLNNGGISLLLSITWADFLLLALKGALIAWRKCEGREGGRKEIAEGLSELCLVCHEAGSCDKGSGCRFVSVQRLAREITQQSQRQQREVWERKAAEGRDGMSLKPDSPHFIIFLQQMHSTSTDIVGGWARGSSRTRMAIQGLVRIWLVILIILLAEAHL